MYSTLLADTTSVCDLSGALTLPSGHPKARYIGQKECFRVFARGGFYFDAPSESLLTLPRRMSPQRVDTLRTGMMLLSPWVRLQPTAPTVIPYSYESMDNQGTAHSYMGDQVIDETLAELLGWLVGDGTVTSERQSIRFSNSDVWCLTRVQELVERAFPTVKVSWYAKNAGFDITLTGGINNPLKHFIRRMNFQQGFPTAVSLFDRACVIAFLRGIWGAHGWASSRKGGNDIDMGIRRSNNSSYTSLLRDLHASIGMRGQRRDTPTKANPDKHRLVFSGYSNYRVFYDMVGRIAEKNLQAPPVRRRDVAHATQQDSIGNVWYETQIQRIIRLPEVLPVYKVEHGY